MIANPVLRKMVELPYAAVRTPLALLDRRLPANSSAHRVLERGLSGLDGLAVGLLTEPADYPSAQSQPASDSVPDSAELDHERELVEEAIRAEQPDVGELADPELDVAEVQAKLRAKHLIEERLEQQERG